MLRSYRTPERLGDGGILAFVMPETITRPGIEIIEETDSDLDKPYHLILLDDNEHTYNYVIRMLGAVFGYSKEKAFAMACVVDSEGRCILMTGSHDEVERKQDQVHGFGADPHMPESKGSMSAIIEAAALRLRPILMTTAAMILGAVPLALATGAGAESRQQIGWVIVGGMGLGTILTLYVVPCIYAVMGYRPRSAVMPKAETAMA